MCESDCAHAKLVKSSQQFQIGAERLDAFHGNEQRDFASLVRIKNLLMTFANSEAPRFSCFRIKTRDLIERHAQTHLWHIAIFDINRRAQDADIAGFEFRQKIRGQYVCAIPFFVQVHWHVEVKIHNSIGVQLVDSLFDRFLGSGHNVWRTFSDLRS